MQNYLYNIKYMNLIILNIIKLKTKKHLLIKHNICIQLNFNTLQEVLA